MASEPLNELRVDSKRWRQHLKSQPLEDARTIVGVASSHTAEPLESQLGARLLDFNEPSPRILFADYGQIHAACLDPVGLFGTKLQHLILLVRIEDMFPADSRASARGAQESTERITAEFTTLASLIAGLADSSDIEITVCLPPVPIPPGIDQLDPVTTVPLQRLHFACNQELLQAFNGKPSIRVVDTESLIASVGRVTALDSSKWAMYRQPYGNAMWGELASSCALAISRRTSPPPKCIVLDCDNTLWGGIIGEDGLGGIDLGEDFPGRCFTEFQQSLLDVRERGTLLAICSKNEEVDVREAFDNHDAMQLRPSDISAWRVNWEPKSVNIASIASELNIDLNSIVFIDDSDYEIGGIEASLPEVRCLQVPHDLALLPNLIAKSRLFAMTATTSEDLQRTEMIQAEGARREATKTMDQSEYLASLDLRVTLNAAHPEQLGRVAQLVNKTNQFNCTTVRRTEAEITALANDKDWTVWAMAVEDKFGDYGLVGVAIINGQTEAAEIDTLLMSCRVLGRGVETALISEVVRVAFNQGATTVTGRYLPTRKNAQVADLFGRHGFTAISEEYFTRSDCEDLEIPSHINVRSR